RQFAERYRRRVRAIADRALDLLRNHAWVGNVRELRNVIERAVIVTADDTLRAEHLPDELRGEEASLPDRPQGGTTLLTLAELEARHIARVLAHTSGRIGAAAEILGIHRNTLTRKMKEYGLWTRRSRWCAWNGRSGCAPSSKRSRRCGPSSCRSPVPTSGRCGRAPARTSRWANGGFSPTSCGATCRVRSIRSPSTSRRCTRHTSRRSTRSNAATRVGS